MNPSPPTLELMTDSERHLAESADYGPDDFVTRFVSWAALRTNASPYVVQAAGLTALSLAAGDVVYTRRLVGGTGPLYLNLFVFVIGPSTVTRKSTSLSLVRDIVPTNRQNGAPVVRVVDDVSTQAFNRAAAEAGKSSTPLLFNVDEAAALFEIQGRKGSYLKGLDKALMKCYDHSPVLISRTSGDIDAPRGAFTNVFAASTEEPLAEVLSDTDVTSGLLPRFLIFDATDATPAPRLSLMQRQTTEADSVDMAEALRDSLYEIGRARFDGVPATTTSLGVISYPETTLEFTPEAIERLDELEALTQTGHGSDDGTAAILGRSFDQVVKVAGLYALSRAGLDTTIELGDVLRSLRLIETTTSDLVGLRDRLGATHFERNIAKVEAMLAATSGAVPIARISSDLKLSARDTAAVISTLTTRGLVRVDGQALIPAGRLTADEARQAKRLAKAREAIDEAGGEWVSATEVDAATGKRGGVPEMLDALVATGDYEDETTVQPPTRKIRRVQ